MGILPVLLLVLVLAGCSGAIGDERAAPGRTAACGPVEQVPVQGGAHLIGDQQPPVPYTSTPPTSGWHSSGAFEIAVSDPDDPLPEPRQVSVLEAGGVVVTYRGLTDADRERLEAHVAGGPLAGRVAVTPYEALDEGAVVFTGWGVHQRCDALDLDALDAFAATYAAPEPDVPGTH